MRVHLVQLDSVWEDPVANRDKAARLIAAAMPTPGDLILLPEMFDTGFSFEIDRTADREGLSQRFIAGLASKHRALVIGGVTVEEADGSARNRAIIAGPNGAIVGQYDKSRMFPLGSPSEADRLTPGNRIVVIRWQAADAAMNVSPFICYDLRFPELFGEALRAGAEAFAVIANWPALRAAHWRALVIARAIENQAFVFAVNRAGEDPSLKYAGGSLIVDPLGRVLAEAISEEMVLTVEVNRGELDTWRGRFPAWKGRKDG